MTPFTKSYSRRLFRCRPKDDILFHGKMRVESSGPRWRCLGEALGLIQKSLCKVSIRENLFATSDIIGSMNVTVPLYAMCLKLP